MFKTGKLISLVLLPVLTSSLQAAERDGKEIFINHCAACHGPAGKPDTDNPVFNQQGVMPANFTDALFNSREPAMDWFLVVKEGGAAKGFSEVMPAFKEQLSDEEIHEVVTYIKTLAGEHDYPSGDMNFILPIRTKKAFPEDEVVWKVRFQDNAGNSNHDQLSNVLEIEKRIFERTQISVELSHRFDDAIDNGRGNFDQIEPGIKHVVYENPAARTIASLGMFFAFKTEEHDASDEFTPYIAAGKQLTDTLTLQRK